MVPTVVALILAGGLAPTQLDDDPFDDDPFDDDFELEDPFAKPVVEGGGSGYPLNIVERPLTLRADLFDIRFEAGVAQLSSKLVGVTLAAAAEYGITDHLQLGLQVIRAVVSGAENTGLDLPSLALQYGFAVGPFEASARAEQELPIELGPLETRISLPMLLRVGRWVRLDLDPAFVVETTSDIDLRLLGRGDLTFRVIDALAVSGIAEVELYDLEAPDNVLLRLGGRISVAIGDQTGADMELSALVLAPPIVLSGARPPDPLLGNYVQGTLLYRLFFDGPVDQTPDVDL